MPVLQTLPRIVLDTACPAQPMLHPSHACQLHVPEATGGACEMSGRGGWLLSWRCMHTWWPRAVAESGG